jgi:hypothetical protein
MRRILLLFTAAAMMSVVLGMSAGPASAQDWSSWDWDHDGPHFDGPHFPDFIFFDNFDNDNGFGPEFDDQELESGDIETETDISIDGSNNNQCVGLSQFGNTGNFANQQGTSNFGGFGGFFDDDDNHDGIFGHDDDDFRIFGGDNGEFEQEFEGPEFTFAPENETGCEQAVQQSSAASSSW